MTAAGNPTVRLDGVGGRWSTDWSTRGVAWSWPTAESDPTGATAVTFYDREGRVTSERSPRGEAAYGRAAAADRDTQAAQFDTVYGFDAMGRVTDIWDPPSSFGAPQPRGRTQVRLDAFGNQTRLTNPEDQQVDYTWTPAGRPATQRTHRPCLGAPSCVTEWRYDGAGNMTAEFLSTSGGQEPSGRAWSYDDGGRLTSESLTDSRAVSVDAAGEVSTSQVTVTTSYTTDADGNRTGWRTAPGPSHSASYNPDGTVASEGWSVAAAGGFGAQAAQTTFRYDADARLEEATLPDGALRRLTLDRSGLVTLDHTEWVPGSGLGVATGYRYDGEGRLRATIAGEGGTVAGVETVTYDPAGRVRDVVAGATTTGDYLDAVVVSAGGQNVRERTEYDADGNVVAVTATGGFATPEAFGDRGWATEYEVDNRGLVRTVWTPRSGASPTGPVGCSVRDRAWKCPTVTTYDRAGRPVGATVAGHPSVDGRDWSVDGLVTSESRPSPTGTGSQTTTRTYDPTGGGRDTVVSAGGAELWRSTQLLSPSGLLLASSAPGPEGRLAVQWRSYDDAGQATGVSGPGATQVTWDGLTGGGLPRRETQAATPHAPLVTTLAYDGALRVTSVTGPLAGAEGSAVESFTWNGDGSMAGRRQRVTAEADRVTSYGYDQAGRPVLEYTTGPTQGPASSAAPAWRQVVAAWTPAGLAAGRSEMVAFGVNPQVDTTFSYGPDAQVASVRSGTSTVTSSFTRDGLLRRGGGDPAGDAIDYDGRGLVVGERSGTLRSTVTRNDAGYPVAGSLRPAGRAQLSWTASFDGLGRPGSETVTDPGDGATQREWDYTDGRLAALTVSSAPDGQSFSQIGSWSYRWNPDGSGARVTVQGAESSADADQPETRTRTAAYDAAGRLGSITRFDTETPAEERRWISDAAGADTGPATSRTAYTFDTGGRRSEATTTWTGEGNPPVNSLAREVFTFDHAGTPTSRQVTLHGAGGNNQTYDRARYSVTGWGEVAGDGCHRSTFDGAARTARTVGAGSGNGGRELCPPGARDATPANFTYDALGRRVGGPDGPQTYAHLSDQLLTSGGDLYAHGVDSGDPMAMWGPDGVELLHADGLGDISLVVEPNKTGDGDGGIECDAAYDPWGRPVEITAADNPLEGVRHCRRSGDHTDNVLWHQGQPATAGTGAYGSYTPTTATTTGAGRLNPAAVGLAATTTMASAGNGNWGWTGATLPGGFNYTHKNGWAKWSAGAHAVLDVAGFIPVIGDVLDAVNAGIYLLEGNVTMAALSGLAVIPIAGSAIAVTAKVGVRAAVKATARSAGQGLQAAIGGVRRAGGAVVGGARRAGDSLLGAARRNAPCNSFTPGTRVLMADGTTKAIEQVQLGDLVWATDPQTGEEGPRAVTRLITGHGDKTLVDITVDGETVTATANHPIWVDDRGEWVDAEDLQPGDRLLDEHGVTLLVEDIQIREVSDQTVHNLTVDDLHTFFVLAGDTPILTHNDSCPIGGSSAPRTTPALGSGPRPFGELASPSTVNNAGTPIRSFTTAQDQTYYRVFSGQNRTGGYLTGSAPASADDAVRGLALPPGNRADFLQEVTVPAGTRLQSSVATEAFGQPGGYLQFELIDLIDPKNFGPGVPFR